MSSSDFVKIKGKIAETKGEKTKGEKNAVKAKPERNEALIVALQNTPPAQQNND